MKRSETFQRSIAFRRFQRRLAICLLAIFILFIVLMVWAYTPYLSDNIIETETARYVQAHSEQLPMASHDFRGGMHRELLYDVDTHIVYMVSKHGEYYPYLSENGHYMRYIDGELEEVN